MNALLDSLYVYKAIDAINDQHEEMNYPSLHLNSLETSGLPPHILCTKFGTPVMLHYNLKLLYYSFGPQIGVKKTNQWLSKLS